MLPFKLAAWARSSLMEKLSPPAGSKAPNAVSSRRTKVADVGADEGTPVTEDYKVPFKFTGKISQVTIELLEMKKTDLEDARQARKAAALRKGLAD